MDPQVLLPPGAGLVVEQVQVCGETIHLTVRREAAGANCPDCGFWSEAFHSGYQRNLGDLPIAGRQAVVDLRVRRFRCYQLECPRKTFVEQAHARAEGDRVHHEVEFVQQPHGQQLADDGHRAAHGDVRVARFGLQGGDSLD